MFLNGHIRDTPSLQEDRERWRDNVTEDCQALHASLSEANRHLLIAELGGEARPGTAKL